MNVKVTSNVTELPNSCKSAMEHMAKALEAEDQEFGIARIDSSCMKKIGSLESSLSETLGRQVSLVAYEKKEE